MARRSGYSPRQARGKWPAVLAAIMVCAVAGAVVFVARPDLGAQSVDVLRDWIGDQPVAQLENTIFGLQDAANSLGTRLGWTKPAAPWAAPPVVAVAPRTAPSAHPMSPPGARANGVSLQKAVAATPAPARVWPPAALSPLGTLEGEGQWSPYLFDPSGAAVAYRTFLQPDPQRPYAIAAIVAFDTQRTRLHFVLGTDEPRSPVAIARPGTIPAADRRPGVLLAAFNGGFKARHGHFGVMVGGTTILPPRSGFGTVAMYKDGRVRIGAWGSDIAPASNLLAWRQNGPLVIEHGRINPHTADTTSQDWGIILKGVTAVWRSGLAISPDGNIMYYVAGTSLTLPTLVRTLAATGAASALQLDINTTMVHFDAFAHASAGWISAPLLDVMKPQQDDRYLTSWSRDYFYVTAVSQ